MSKFINLIETKHETQSKWACNTKAILQTMKTN